MARPCWPARWRSAVSSPVTLAAGQSAPVCRVRARPRRLPPRLHPRHRPGGLAPLEQTAAGHHRHHAHARRRARRLGHRRAIARSPRASVRAESAHAPRSGLVGKAAVGRDRDRHASGGTTASRPCSRRTATVVDGVLRGDLVVVGSGDPSIGGRGGEDLTAWIDTLKALGVQSIQGRVIGDDDLLEEPRPAFSWAWDDLATSGALYGALNFEENRMTVTVTPGAMPGESAAARRRPDRHGSSAHQPGRHRRTHGRAVDLERTAARRAGAHHRRNDPRRRRAGEADGRRGQSDALVRPRAPLSIDRSRYRRERRGRGHRRSSRSRSTAVRCAVLYTHRSPSARRSDQTAVQGQHQSVRGSGLPAERAARACPPTMRRSSASVRSSTTWGMTPDGQQVVDGSGLSRRDVIAADTLVNILQRMYDADPAAPWMVALPLAGVDGTLQNRMRATPAERNVRAKTGSMSNVRSLAGYVTTREWRTPGVRDHPEQLRGYRCGSESGARRHRRETRVVHANAHAG